MGWAIYPKDNEDLNPICSNCLEPMKEGDKFYMAGLRGSREVVHFLCELNATERAKRAISNLDHS